MIIELVEETKYNGEPWYTITADGKWIYSTGNKLNAEKAYSEIIADPEIIKTKRNILSSQEVDVSLQETNQ